MKYSLTQVNDSKIGFSFDLKDYKPKSLVYFVGNGNLLAVP